MSDYLITYLKSHVFTKPKKKPFMQNFVFMKELVQGQNYVF